MYLNGEFLPAEQARISVFDRGFLFGDGVYEGLRATQGVVVGLDRHIARMRAGIEETRLEGFDPGQLGDLTRTLLDANGFDETFVYWQVTRGTPLPGTPSRSRVPGGALKTTVFGFCTPVRAVSSYTVPDIKHVALRPDTRWMRGHVKGISLLGGVLAALEASEAGYDDAIMVRDGLVTEGTATNVFLTTNGKMRTPALSSSPMLAGVTRALILGEDPAIEERPVTHSELLEADEVMLVGTQTMVVAVVSIDGRPVGDAAARDFRPGPGATSLLRTLVRAIDHDVHCRHA